MPSGRKVLVFRSLRRKAAHLTASIVRCCVPECPSTASSPHGHRRRHRRRVQGSVPTPHPEVPSAAMRLQILSTEHTAACSPRAPWRGTSRSAARGCSCRRCRSDRRAGPRRAGLGVRRRFRSLRPGHSSGRLFVGVMTAVRLGASNFLQRRYVRGGMNRPRRVPGARARPGVVLRHERPRRRA